MNRNRMLCLSALFAAVVLVSSARAGAGDKPGLEAKIDLLLKQQGETARQILEMRDALDAQQRRNDQKNADLELSINRLKTRVADLEATLDRIAKARISQSYNPDQPPAITPEELRALRDELRALR